MASDLSNVCSGRCLRYSVLNVQQSLSQTFARTRVLFASLTRHTLRLWALTRPSAQPTVPGQREQAFNPGFTLVVCVAHVVIGHG